MHFQPPGQAVLNSSWGYYKNMKVSGAKAFRSQAKANVASLIDEIYEDLVEYYRDNFVSTSQKSALTVNYDIYENAAYIKYLEFIKEFLKTYYLTQYMNEDVPASYMHGDDSSSYSYDWDDEDVYYVLQCDGYKPHQNNPNRDNNNPLDKWAAGTTTISGKNITTTWKTGLVFMSYRSDWPGYNKAYVKYVINKAALKNKFIALYSSSGSYQSLSNHPSLMVINTASMSGLNSSFNGLYRLGNGGNASYGYYYNFNNACSTAAGAIVYRLGEMGVALKNAGLNATAVNTAINIVSERYQTMLNEIKELNNNISGSSTSTGCSTKTVPNVQPQKTFGVVKYSKAKTCEGVSGPPTGTSGILVRCSTAGNTSWRIDVDQGKLLQAVLSEFADNP